MKILINDLKWEVKLGTNEELKQVHNSTDYDLYFGVTEYLTQTIYLLKNPTDILRFKRTVIHELLHAILFSYGNVQNTYTEEQVCEICSSHHKFLETTSMQIIEYCSQNGLYDDNKEDKE